ncbi:unnamed protein product [Paramecium sonneborni]|uniref:Tetratricopeptide repeat protein n=1 Tax=Paramecium sonneborni TaxID=65129 RepID=A0A8S1RVL3_9CILI|nr:unnamed protein product [Paramecium sonneborni]
MNQKLLGTYNQIYLQVIKTLYQLIVSYISLSINDFNNHQDTLLTKNQNDVIGLISKIFILENGNQLDEALNFCEITLLVDNINLLARYRKSVELLELKQFEEALQVIEEIFKINKNYNAGYLIKGRILQKQQRYNEALDFINLYLKLDPIKQIGNYHKSLLLYDMKCYDEAIVCLDQLQISINKKIQLFNLNQTKTLYQQIKIREIEELKLYEKAIFAMIFEVLQVHQSVGIKRLRCVKNQLDQIQIMFTIFK